MEPKPSWAARSMLQLQGCWDKLQCVLKSLWRVACLAAGMLSWVSPGAYLPRIKNKVGSCLGGYCRRLRFRCPPTQTQAEQTINKLCHTLRNFINKLIHGEGSHNYGLWICRPSATCFEIVHRRTCYSSLLGFNTVFIQRTYLGHNFSTPG